jgi:mannose-6-phosphate isomerase-like protein (cupin superfamily)
MNSEARPWGSYEVIGESALYKIKSIIVNPGKRLSYQKHEKRAEHWLVVTGTATVTIDGKVSEIKPGEAVDIGIGVPHRVANNGSSELKIIEVQTGTYFGEDDIIRLEDDFGRAG